MLPLALCPEHTYTFDRCQWCGPGHHFRLLDRLDDGWKPFWLDTLVVDAQQTQRIAFLAETPGSWLMQAKAMDWAAPTLIQMYEIT